MGFWYVRGVRGLEEWDFWHVRGMGFSYDGSGGRYGILTWRDVFLVCERDEGGWSDETLV